MKKAQTVGGHVPKGVFTVHNETGLMPIQTGLIHFGRVHTESGLNETGFKPV